MAVRLQSRSFALDTNVPLDLAAGVEAAWTLVEVSKERNWGLAIPPTVVQELAFISQNFSHPANRLAIKALSELRSWGIEPFNLISAGHGITEQFSRSLRDKGLLPDGEDNDGLILAETSLAEFPVLVTRDRHLLGIDVVLLQSAFRDASMENVTVITPRRLLATFNL